MTRFATIRDGLPPPRQPLRPFFALAGALAFTAAVLACSHIAARGIALTAHFNANQYCGAC